MAFRKDDVVDYRSKIQIDLIKLIGGERLVRLSYPPIGLVLEKKLEPLQPVASQKEQLFGVFEAALEKAELKVA